MKPLTLLLLAGIAQVQCSTQISQVHLARGANHTSVSVSYAAPRHKDACAASAVRYGCSATKLTMLSNATARVYTFAQADKKGHSKGDYNSPCLYSAWLDLEECVVGGAPARVWYSVEGADDDSWPRAFLTAPAAGLSNGFTKQTLFVVGDLGQTSDSQSTLL